MTDGHVDGYNMLPPDPRDDEALEAYLSGRSGPGDLADSLTSFATELDVVASGPAPAPKANLAALLRDGFTPEAVTQPVPRSLPEAWAPVRRPWAAPPAAPAGPSSTSSPWWHRVVPKLAGLGLAAKVGLGFGVAAAGATGAGAAGVLPDPAQHVVATVFDTVTPFEFPNPATGRPTADAPGSTGDRRSGTAGQTGPGGVAKTPTAGGSGGVSVGPSGATGLDRANQTPAAGNVPTSLPQPGGSPGQQGLDRANETPAAGNVPTSLPTPTTTLFPGQRGLDRANETPAGDRGLNTTTTSTTTTLAP